MSVVSYPTIEKRLQFPGIHSNLNSPSWYPCQDGLRIWASEGPIDDGVDEEEKEKVDPDEDEDEDEEFLDWPEQDEDFADFDEDDFDDDFDDDFEEEIEDDEFRETSDDFDLDSDDEE